MNTVAAILVAGLCLSAWAADDAAVDQQAVVHSPSSVADDVDAVTIPRMLSYQGKLTDTLGIPVPDTTYQVNFRLYAVPSGGSPFWNETQTVRTKDGLFSALLGSVTAIDSLPDAGVLYLGMAVAGGAELAPRLRIVSSAYAFLCERAANADALQGRDTVHFDSRYVNENQFNSVTGPMLVNGAVTTTKIFDGEVNNADLAPAAVTGDKLNQMGATTNQVLKWTGTTWAPRNDSVGGGGGTVTSVGQGTGVTCTPNPITTSGTVALNTTYTDGQYVNATGDSMSGMLRIGGQLRTHDKAALGYSCYNSGAYAFCAGDGNSASGDRSSITGGSDNSADGRLAHISGGSENVASATWSTVGGGNANEAVDSAATVAGGQENYADGVFSTVGGGIGNTASGNHGTVGGGWSNTASNMRATVGGGLGNTASGSHATVGGGWSNTASGWYATVGGGGPNLAGGTYSCVPGGYADTASGDYSFAANNNSNAAYDNSAAFNGQTATASSQTRVGALSKASGTFTIDHPLDPYGKILNHYFIEGPEMRNIYEGSVVLDATGLAEVTLPDYFSALNRNPHIQLTGVGSADVVYVAEKLSGNRFIIGGKPGMEVYWQVTGERQDVSAEVTRRMMPVEQPKTGELAGRMLDDDFLSGCMGQLVREGKAQGIDFRTAAGRMRYEQMRRMTERQ